MAAGGAAPGARRGRRGREGGGEQGRPPHRAGGGGQGGAAQQVRRIQTGDRFKCRLFFSSTFNHCFRYRGKYDKIAEAQAPLLLRRRGEGEEDDRGRACLSN